MAIRLTSYLGSPVSNILTAEPFNSWKFKRSVDSDLPDKKINYTTDNRGMSIVCDRDENVRSIFIDAEKFDQTLFDISFLSNRNEVLALLGEPTKKGGEYNDSILGKYGHWDRFDGKLHSIHVEYRVDADRIRRVTLMRADAVP